MAFWNRKKVKKSNAEIDEKIKHYRKIVEERQSLFKQVLAIYNPEKDPTGKYKFFTKNRYRS